jgi:hypothetical protein
LRVTSLTPSSAASWSMMGLTSCMPLFDDNVSSMSTPHA